MQEPNKEANPLVNKLFVYKKPRYIEKSDVS